jgi:hypothetical protein
MRSLHEEVWRAPRAAILVGAALAIVIAGRAMAWEGHARPEPHCVINDHDPPTNVRTQPNGVIVGTLHNGEKYASSIRHAQQHPAGGLSVACGTL